MATSSQLQNIYHLRTVAETSAKPCFICYKPSTAVLTTPDSKDFFYACRSHLTDKGFASPIVDEKAEAEKRKKEAMDREIEKVKKEYEEKMKAKRAKKKEKEKEKGKDEEGKKEGDAEADVEKERDEKIKAIQSSTTTPSGNDGPRIFALHRNFFQMRLDRLRGIEAAKRNQQRLRDPNFFPAAPKGELG